MLAVAGKILRDYGKVLGEIDPVDPRAPVIQFQLNVENLLDRRYSRESVCNGGLGRNDCFDFWGLPRSLQLEMRLGL